MKRRRAVPRFAVGVDGRGVTGRAGTALLAEAADAIRLTGGRTRAAGGCRRWVVHEPGKVVRDLVVTLADGGDALRHLAVLGGEDQQPLFGPVASAATANRTIRALGDDELVAERIRRGPQDHSGAGVGRGGRAAGRRAGASRTG